MSRKLKSTKYTQYSQPLSHPHSYRNLSMSEKRISRNTIVETVLEEILQNTEQIILTNQQTQQRVLSIFTLFQQCNQDYLYLSNYSSFVPQMPICELEPSPTSALEAHINKKHHRQQPQYPAKRFSKHKLNSCDLQDIHKSLEKCKKEKELKRHCSNGNFLPLQYSGLRLSQDNNEEIQQLLRRKKELILQVRKDPLQRLKTKVVSTQRKQKRYFFHDDSGQACELNFSEPITKINRLVHVDMKVQQGQNIATNLKKKAIVEFTANTKKSRRRIDRNLGDTCVLIEQIKQNDISLQSAINRAHNEMKTVKLKTEDEWIPSAVKLPAVR